MFDVFEHTADLGIRIQAPDLPTLYAEAGIALFSIIVAEPSEIRCNMSVEFSVSGSERDYLMLDWLNELLYCFDPKRLLLREFKVKVNQDGLEAVAKGEPYDPKRHALEHEVKAITYHGLMVERKNGDWFAEVILDI